MQIRTSYIVIIALKPSMCFVNIDFSSIDVKKASMKNNEILYIEHFLETISTLVLSHQIKSLIKLYETEIKLLRSLHLLLKKKSICT